jgi:hypothetical protein
MKKIAIALVGAGALALTAVAAPQDAYARDRGGAVAAGVIGGLAAGAIIGGAIASSPPAYAAPAYAPPPAYAPADTGRAGRCTIPMAVWSAGRDRAFSVRPTE